MALTRHVRDTLKIPSLWVSRDIWALNYQSNEGTSPHVHKGTPYSVIWYVVADDGCGSLEFFRPNQSVQPTKNMCVIFKGSHCHGVLPSIDPLARRMCLVGEVYDLTTMGKMNHPKGFYNVDPEFQ